MQFLYDSRLHPFEIPGYVSVCYHLFHNFSVLQFPPLSQYCLQTFKIIFFSSGFSSRTAVEEDSPRIYRPSTLSTRPRRRRSDYDIRELEKEY